MFIWMSLSNGSPYLQLSSAAFYLFESVRNPSSNFSVADLATGASYRIISSFITSLLEQGPHGSPNISYLSVLDKS